MSEHLRMVFRDRHDAGRQLAEQLGALEHEQPVVIALPRGGVPVGFEIAKALGAPLDVLEVRKLGAPGNPEFAVGAIAEDGTAILNAAVARRVGMTQQVLNDTVEREALELRRRVERYRDGRGPADVSGRTVIVVDDGLATGLTALAAVRALRARGARRIVVAVPVGARESLDLVGEEADGVVCHTVPRELYGVGNWYDDFSPVSDVEVVGLLGASFYAGAPAAAPAQASDGNPPGEAHEVRLDIDRAALVGDLTVPPRSRGLVIFAHGSGSSRRSPRNGAVAATLNHAGFATLLFDLLTAEEALSSEFVFDIPLLARRLELVTRWACEASATSGLPIGYFGASTGAAAALRAAAEAHDAVHAVVSRGGRPDLASDRLPDVKAPTLLLVGDRDSEVLALNRDAAELLRCPHRVSVVKGAGHLFEEPGTLEIVARLAADWFAAYLAVAAPPLAATGA